MMNPIDHRAFAPETGSLRVLRVPSLVLLALLATSPVFAAQPAPSHPAAPSVQTYDDGDPMPVIQNGAPNNGMPHKMHKHMRHHHPMTTYAQAATVYSNNSDNGYDPRAAERRELWHEHYVIEAERVSLKLECMDAKGQDRSDCEEKWEDVRLQQDRLMARIQVLDSGAPMPMHPMRDCPPTPAGAPPAHCGMPHDGMDHHGYHEAGMMMPMRRPSQTAIPPITTPNAPMWSSWVQ